MDSLRRRSSLLSAVCLSSVRPYHHSLKHGTVDHGSEGCSSVVQVSVFYSLTDVQKHVKLVLFVSLSASAVISVVFLKETLRASDILGEIRVLLTSHSEVLVNIFLVFSCCIEKIIKLKLYYIYI